MENVRDLVAEREAGELRERVGGGAREVHEVVAADRQHLDGVRKLVAPHAGVGVRRDQLLRVLAAHGGDGLEERDELLGVGALVEVEVEAVAHLDDVRRVGVRAVLEDELLDP